MALLSTFINYQLFFYFANPGLINYHQPNLYLLDFLLRKKGKKNPRIPKSWYLPAFRNETSIPSSARDIRDWKSIFVTSVEIKGKRHNLILL